MSDTEIDQQPEAGGQMSFLEHLDELRKRLRYFVLLIVIFFMACWFVSDKIYNFLSVPIRRALSEAERRDLPVSGLTGNEKVLTIDNLKENDEGRYIFADAFSIGPTVVAPGTSIRAKVS